MTSPEAQMGKFVGGIGATAINPSSAPTNLLSMFAKNGGKYRFGDTRHICSDISKLKSSQNL